MKPENQVTYWELMELLTERARQLGWNLESEQVGDSSEYVILLVERKTDDED